MSALNPPGPPDDHTRQIPAYGQVPPALVPPRKSRQTLWIVLGMISGLLVLCCGGITAIGALVPAQKTAAVSKSPATHKAAAPKPSTTTTPAASATAAATTPAPALTTPTPARTTAIAVAPPQPASPVDQMICRVDDNGGSYYLNVTSATDHNFQACDGATPFAGTIDDLFKLPNIDRRCILPNEYVAANHALVSVYSDTKSPDITAARQFCAANGGTND